MFPGSHIEVLEVHCQGGCPHSISLLVLQVDGLRLDFSRLRSGSFSGFIFLLIFLSHVLLLLLLFSFFFFFFCSSSVLVLVRNELRPNPEEIHILHLPRHLRCLVDQFSSMVCLKQHGVQVHDSDCILHKLAPVLSCAGNEAPIPASREGSNHHSALRVGLGLRSNCS